MNARIQAFFKHFDNEINTEIINFCNRISSLDADVFMLMARKSACFFNCLEELGLIHFNGYVTSERILDMNCKWLEGKSVVIIDDSIVSGTTLHSTIEELNRHKVASIDVHVLTVNSEWFSPKLLEKPDGSSYLFPTYDPLPDSRCIKLCNDIVRSIACTPRPYDIDFPYYNEIIVKKYTFYKLIYIPGWEVYDISSVDQEENGITNITLIPNDAVINDFCMDVGLDPSIFCLAKIRLYCRRNPKKKGMFHIRLVPMLIFDDLSIEIVSTMFNAISNSVIDADMSMNEKAMLRFLQFYYSDRFAKSWYNNIQEYLDIKEGLFFESRNLTFLFPSQLVYVVKNLCDTVHQIPSFTYSKQAAEHPCSVKKNTKDPLEDISFEYDSIDNYIAIDDTLVSPFLTMYYTKEIPCRQIVKKLGVKAFESDEYTDLVNRLNNGISISQMCHLITSMSNVCCIATRVSIFIDKSIDAGIIVPITQIKDNMIFRSYRHGEDVLFGAREETMYVSMLEQFQQFSGRTQGLSQIMTEKLIVLFTEIGLRDKFLMPYISNSIINSKDKVLRVKTHLHGKVALVGSAIESMDTKYKPYITTERKAHWFTSQFVQKGKITVNKKNKRSRYYKINSTNTNALTEEDTNKVQIFAQLLADVCNPKIDTGTTYQDNDLVKVTSCAQLKDVIKSLAAEVNIFQSGYVFNNYPDNNNIEADYKNILRFRYNKERTSIHNAYMKMKAYITGEAKELIKSVKFARITDTSQWRIYFKEELNEDISSKNEILLNIFAQQRLWVYSTLLINSCLYACLLSNYFLNYDLMDPFNQSYVISYEDMKRINSDIQAQKALLEDFLTNQFDEKENHYKIIPLVELVLKHIKNKRIVDSGLIDQINMVNDDIQSQCESVQDDVCCSIGSDGKISNIILYNNVLCIQYIMQDSERREHIKRKIKDCLEHKEAQIEKRNKSQPNGRDFPPSLAILPENESPSGFDVKSGIQNIWLRATSEASIDLLALGLNIYYELSKFHTPVRSILFTNMRYTDSVKSDDREVTKYWCNNFLRSIQHFAHIIYPKESFSSEVVVLTEESAVASSKPLQFLENDANRLYALAKEEYIENSLTDRRYRKGHYFIRPEHLNDGGNIMHKDIAIITVLHEECYAVKNIYGLEEIRFEMEDRLFYHGTVTGDNTIHTVVMTQTLNQGPQSIISAYNTLMDKFSPSVIFVIGIAGGIDNKIKICDVVVPREVFCYDLSKDTPDGTERRGASFKVEPKLLPVMQRLQQIIYNKKFGGRDFNIYDDPIGSGSTVICHKLSEITKYLKTVNSKVVAVEMEASGICSAVYEDGVGIRQPTYGVLNFRGISDLADENKPNTGSFRIPAAENAAIVSMEYANLLPKLRSSKK